MSSTFTELVVDCADPAALAAFWCAVLDYDVRDSDSGNGDGDDDFATTALRWDDDRAPVLTDRVTEREFCVLAEQRTSTAHP